MPRPVVSPSISNPYENSWTVDMARRIVRQRTLAIEPTLDEYLKTRTLRERSAWNEDRLKGELMDFLSDNGEEEDGGHRTYTLDQPMEYFQQKAGKAIPKHVTGILRQRRESITLNPERTMALLKAKELMDRCTKVEVVLDEDAILAANYEGEISDADLEALYDKKETFAFYITMDDA